MGIAMSRNAIEILLDADCSIAEKMLLLIIYRHGRGADGKGSFPGVRRLARIAGISTSTTWTSLSAMRGKNWLSWSPGNAREREPNTYTIRFDAIPIIPDLWRSPIQPRPNPVSTADTVPVSISDTPPVSDPVSVAATEANTKQEQEQNLFAQDKPVQATSPRKRKSGKAEPEKPPDPRHTPIRKAWERHFEEQVKRQPPKWNGYEAKALSRFLDDNPMFKVEDFETILANRVRSPGITHAVRLSSWINRTALCWLHGPANDFGRPITGDQATRKPPQKISEIDHAASFGLEPGQIVGRLR
jgi:hypothetical protein